jgi:WD40 repeat protein
VSGSDDMTVKIWDSRARKPINSYSVDYQVTSVAFSYSNDYIFFGGLDNSIKALNIKKN